MDKKTRDELLSMSMDDLCSYVEEYCTSKDNELAIANARISELSQGIEKTKREALATILGATTSTRKSDVTTDEKYDLTDLF